MRSILLLTSVLLFSWTLQGQSDWSWGPGLNGEGPIVKKTLKLSSFEGISLGISGNVYLKQGTVQSVEVESQQNIIDNLMTEVEDKVWKIRFEKNVRKYEKLNIYITLPTLTTARISGSGDIIGKTPFTLSADTKLSISGSGAILLELQGGDVDAAISGSGDIELKGTTNSLKVQISGSGNVNAFGMAAKKATIAVSGSGDAMIHASETLDAAVSGSGDITYKGQPKVKARVSGSGEIIPKEN